MDMLIVNAGQRAALAGLNAADARQQIEPVPLKDGRHALNADLLGDCGEEQTWKRYNGALQALAKEKVEDVPEHRLA